MHISLTLAQLFLGLLAIGILYPASVVVLGRPIARRWVRQPDVLYYSLEYHKLVAAWTWPLTLLRFAGPPLESLVGQFFFGLEAIAKRLAGV